ncbi:MAG TPA: nuclear transport factor 2 family protein [Thermoplasmata archaeon]|nr:nuclear transport factor 2 family protein [Thermoplasmata archaeon]
MPEPGSPSAMSSNKKLVLDHMAAKPAKAAEVLADDFEWIEWADGVPREGVRTKGRAAFVQGFGDDDLRDEIQRVIEEGNVVAVEGVAHVTKKDGKKLDVQFCNIFEVEHGKIKRKSSYAALIKDAA